MSDTKKILRIVEEIRSDLHDTQETMSSFATATEGRFARLEERVDRIEGAMGNMVTKEHFDRRFGELVAGVRNEDDKVNTLVDVLHKRKAISASDRASLRAATPFGKK